MSDFLTYLQVSLRGHDVPELSVAPAIDPKKLDGAQAFALFVGEQPLALLDDTILQSGKEGALLTHLALYLHKPRVRVPLEYVRAAPRWPQGYDRPGVLPTPAGDVGLPSYTSKGLTEALEAVILAIVAWNAGTAHVAPSALPVQGPVGELAARCLRHPRIKLAPAIPRARLEAAAASFPSWVDPLEGEEVVAFVDETASGDGTEGIALTDRRLLAWVSDRGCEAHYAAIAGAQAAGGRFTSDLVVHQAGMPTKVTLVGATDAIPPVAAFLHGLAAMPPAYRQAPPLPPPTPDDPSGAATALGALHHADPRVALLLRYLAASTRAGWLPPHAAADLVARAVLLQRTLASGRGARHGMRLSPLASPDLAYIFESALGPATPTYQGGIAALEYTVKTGAGVGRAVASSAVGLTLLAVVGVGWVSTPGATVRRVRARLHDLPTGTGFELYTERNEVLAKADRGAYASVVDPLPDAEARLLLLRCAFGWTAPPSQLLACPAGSLEARLGAALGPVDLAPFRRASPR